MSMLARQNEIGLAGGDLSRSDKLGISITIFGVAGGSREFLTRGGCEPDDILFTVGDLGLARVGFMTLEAFGKKGREIFPAAINAHLRPKPKVISGTLLNAAGIKGLMDVSDGLARDLPRFLGPDLGADLKISASDLNGNVVAFAIGVGDDPVKIAMLGGEDYALLGAVSPENMDKASSIPGMTIIGTVTDKTGIIVNGTAFETVGFDHFDT
jgi:thiamine-monophosphate kinase